MHGFSVNLLNGGEEEIRTLDPHVANVMLYQLSYFPIDDNAEYFTIIPEPLQGGILFFVKIRQFAVPPYF